MDENRLKKIGEKRLDKIEKEARSAFQSPHPPPKKKIPSPSGNPFTHMRENFQQFEAFLMKIFYLFCD